MVRALVIPNLKDYETLIKDEINNNTIRRAEAEKVVTAIMNALGTLVDEGMPTMNGHTNEAAAGSRSRLVEKVGELIENRIADSGHIPLAKAVLE